GLDPEQRAVALVRDHVQQLVGALTHIADAVPQIFEQGFAAELFHVLVEDDPLQPARARDLAVAHAADEQVAGPAREPAPGIERHAGHRDRGYPGHDGVDHAFAMELVRLKRPGVGAPQADVRPAVVAAGHDDIDLVTAVRAHLALPDRPGRLVPDQALGRAMAERVNLRTVALDADERIVVGYAAVVVVAQDFAAQAVRVLRHFSGLAPRADQERAVRQEQHA